MNLKNQLLILCYFLPFFAFSQGLKESQIPFYLNSDTDALINVIDPDDDNDSVLDNNDAFPLNPAKSSPDLTSVMVSASQDAGFRTNTASNMNTNYGSAAVIQTRGPERSYIVKWTIAPGAVPYSATLSLYTNTETDSLEVFYLPNSNWDESNVTYNSAVGSGLFSGQQFLGKTPTANGGEYTFELPTSIFPTAGGEVTLWIYSSGDTVVEELYTKETPGKAATIELKYEQVPDPRLIIDQSFGTSKFVNNGPIQVGVKLSQEPTSTVWVPFAVSDSTVAIINGDEVLVFDNTNWNTNQILQVDPLKPGPFDLLARPLHSADIFFNGHNPPDLKDYTFNATQITNLAPWTVVTGDTLQETLVAQSGVGSTIFDFQIIEAPLGLNVVENSGAVSFRPLSNQIGSSVVKFQVTDAFGNVSQFETSLQVIDGGGIDPTGIYVVPFADADPAENGSVAHPFNDIAEAVAASASAGGGKVFIRGGEYTQSTINTISTAASGTNAVIVQPLEGEHVKINFDSRTCFEFTDAAKNIEIRDLEIDGNTDEIDFWAIVGVAIWGDETVPRGGGLCIAIDGDSITIRNNYLHDAYQKGVEIRNGRYTDVIGNIIEHIATTSLSGGHGIMRQQKGNEFFDDDNLADYRWDIYGNLIFNVRQQIYSWVPSKNFMEMTLDEGKPILIDDPKDTDNTQEAMTARIKNNVLAFGSIDHIRLKSTPNLEVSQNTIYAGPTPADGITDRGGDTPTPQFTNFMAKNNAVQTVVGRTGIDIDKAIEEAVSNPGTYTVSGNISANGLIKPDTMSGLSQISTSSLFIDPDNGNFRVNPTLSLPSTLGVETAALNEIEANAAKFGVNIKWDGWTNDDMVLTQSILDNIPGVYDAISGNELVFTNPGTFNADTNHIEFDVVNGAWKANNGITVNNHEFKLNEHYVHWYKEALNTYTHQNGDHYERIRWGDTHLKQDFTFPATWLMVSQIRADTNTVMDALGSELVLDGDLLIEFEGLTPVAGDYFDLIVADSIKTANTGSLFDYVQFEGYTPNPYNLEIVNTTKGQALRLSLPNPCSGIVSNKDDTGVGSLREELACASDGGTITISASLQGDTIKITSAALIFDKNVTLISENKMIYVQNCTASEMIVNSGKTVSFQNFQVLSDRFTNNGNLSCTDMTFKAKDGLSAPVFTSGTGSVLQLNTVSSVE